MSINDFNGTFFSLEVNQQIISSVTKIDRSIAISSLFSYKLMISLLYNSFLDSYLVSPTIRLFVSNHTFGGGYSVGLLRTATQDQSSLDLLLKLEIFFNFLQVLKRNQAKF